MFFSAGISHSVFVVIFQTIAAMADSGIMSLGKIDVDLSWLLVMVAVSWTGEPMRPRIYVGNHGVFERRS